MLSAASCSTRRSASAGQTECGIDLNQLAQNIKQWGAELGFQHVGITDTDLSASEPKLQAWLDNQYHGEMEWMARHGMMRARPHELLPGTLRVISVRMTYLPARAAFASTLKDPTSPRLFLSGPWLKKRGLAGQVSTHLSSAATPVPFSSWASY